MTHSTARGALWMVLFKLLERGLGLISTLILARLLLPKDFGIVAMATSIVALLEIFSSFGMDTVLIQRRDADRDHFNTAWTLNVLAGCAVAAVIALLASPTSHFYREPRLVAVMCVLAVTSVIGACENVGVVEFRRQLRFDREFHYLLAKKLMAFVVTVPLALWLRSYWALVLGTLAGRLGAVFYSYRVQPFRPRLSLRTAPEMLHFSKWLMTQDALMFLKDRSASFFIGRLAGPAALGAFSISAEIASMPGTELIAPINRALLPAYVKLAADPAALRREFLSSMSGIALIGVPAVAGVALAAPFIVLLGLGPKWSATQPLLEVLAFFGISQVLQSNSYAAFIALGKPELFARMNTLQVGLLLVGLIGLTPPYGAIGAAWAYVLAALGALPVNFFYIARHLGLRSREFLAAVWRPLVSTTVMYASGRAWGPQLESGASSADALVPLLSCVALGAATYTVTGLALWLAAGRPAGAETWMLRQLRGVVRP
ncbi:MAG TPA: lipopolysaccharide biosynthesis protein [Steroidobacteraceae bacterium]|nr:lipopolysaccharide biosynthesis protein [Steroidobacteraceae bacterium]